MIPFGQGMQIPMMGGINGPQMTPQGQMGIPINIGAMGGGQGIPVMGQNGQIMMMQMIPHNPNQAQSLQAHQAAQNSNSAANSTQNNNPQNTPNSNPLQLPPGVQQIMMPGGMPLNFMQGVQGLPGFQTNTPGAPGIQGINPMMMPQGLNVGLFANPQLGLPNPNNPNNPNQPNPNLQGPFVGLNQIPNLSGANGIPMNLLMAQNMMQQQADKNKQA